MMKRYNVAVFLFAMLVASTHLLASEPPTITAISPPDGETGVSVVAIVSATFSQAMEESTITTSTFTVSDSSGAITGAVSYDATTNTATFTPDGVLVEGMTYTATVTTDIQDKEGSHLASNFSWNFTVEKGGGGGCSLILRTR